MSSLDEFIHARDVVHVSDLVTDALRNAILTKRYPPGTRLRQEEVAQTLGVSRQPVRDAMKQMIGEGLLVSGSKGYIVREFTPEYLAENYRLRALLEGEAASLAASRISAAEIEELIRANGIFGEANSGGAHLRANYDFHKLIRGASASPTLEKIVDELWLVTTIATPVIIPGRLEHSQAEHLNIIAALEAGNGEAARTAMRLHIQNAAVKYFGSIPEPDTRFIAPNGLNALPEQGHE